MDEAFIGNLMSDEIFADIIFEDTSVPVYTRIAEEDSLAISCTSAGKTFSLTGVNHANVWIKNPILRERFVKQRDADHYGSLDPMVCAGLISAYTEEGKAFLKKWGIEGDYVGVGNCILGYRDCELPQPKERKANYIYRV